MTFPRPAEAPEVEAVGQELEAMRRRIMSDQSIGLTEIYNRVNDLSHEDDAVYALRSLPPISMRRWQPPTAGAT